MPAQGNKLVATSLFKVPCCFFFNQVARLVGSQFLIQGSNPGPESESFEPQPLDSQGIPHNSWYCFIFNISSFIWLLWVLVAAHRISAASRGIFARTSCGPWAQWGRCAGLTAPKHLRS